MCTISKEYMDASKCLQSDFGGKMVDGKVALVTGANQSIEDAITKNWRLTDA